MTNIIKYGILVGVNAIYACEAICNKYASMHEFMSMGYVLGVVAAVIVLAIYAVAWQQILKQIPLTDAYMFKGTSLIFVLLFSVMLFREGISWTNLCGVAVIIIGTVLYAYADRKEGLA